MELSELNRKSLPQIGAMIGECELLELMGAGGFGAVFKARQARLNRDVAIKVVLPTAAATVQNAAERFLREIDLVSRLEHPNIVRLYDFGKTPEGLLWMSMELVRGDLLGMVMAAEKRLNAARVRHIGMQILSGLIEAHDQQIIHRDLKPANIMLTRKGVEYDFVKLLDFGIGKALGPGESERFGDLTASSATSYGTPRYMAPEQIYNTEVGPHTDVYSVGLILYEMLLGMPAVPGENPFETLAHQVTRPIVFPQELVRTALGAVLQRATAKEWEQRYPTAHAFYEDLRAVDPAQVPSFSGMGSADLALDTGPRRDISSQITTPTGAPPLDKLRVEAGMPPGGAVATSAPPRPAAQLPAGEQAPAVATRRPPVWLFVLTGAMVLLAAGGLVYKRVTKDAAPDASEPAAEAPEVAAAPEPTEAGPGHPPEVVADASAGEPQPPPAGEPAAEQAVTLKLRTEPAGASVFEGTDLLGVTPFQMRLERDSLGDPPRQFVLRQQGYLPYVHVQGPTDEAEVVVSVTLDPATQSTPTAAADEPSASETTRRRRVRRRTRGAEPEPTGGGDLDIKLER